MRGYKIVRFYIEKKSASKGYRPVYDEMIANIKNGEADGFIVHKYDRSFRNDEDEYEIKQLIAQGYDVLSANEDFDFDKAYGRLMFDITG